LDETGMVTIEEKEALFAVKDQLETPGEGNGE